MARYLPRRVLIQWKKSSAAAEATFYYFSAQTSNYSGQVGCSSLIFWQVLQPVVRWRMQIFTSQNSYRGMSICFFFSGTVKKLKSSEVENISESLLCSSLSLSSQLHSCECVFYIIIFHLMPHTRSVIYSWQFVMHVQLYIRRETWDVVVYTHVLSVLYYMYQDDMFTLTPMSLHVCGHIASLYIRS